MIPPGKLKYTMLCSEQNFAINKHLLRFKIWDVTIFIRMFQ